MNVYDTVHRNISLKAIMSMYFKRVYNSLYMSQFHMISMTLVLVVPKLLSWVL